MNVLQEFVTFEVGTEEVADTNSPVALFSRLTDE